MIKLTVLAAVLNQHSPGAGAFAPYFLEYGIKYKFDPILVAAVAFKESRFNQKAVSRTNDYGLMQIHVGTKFHKEYNGRERALFAPRKNIKIGAKLMRMWKTVHRRRCQDQHHWLNHYNQGTRVSKKKWHRGYADRVLSIYSRLKKIERAINDNKKRTVL